MSKFSKPLFILSSFLMATVHAWAIDDSSDFDSNEKSKEPRQEQIQTNVPEEIQKEFHEQTKDYITALQEQGKNFNFNDYSDDPEYSYSAETSEAIRNSMVAMERHDYYCKDPKSFRSIMWHSFETNSKLTSTAQEPLFLDNKEEFSVEIRPFFDHTTRNHIIQLGSIITARKQWQNRYISGQLLYGLSLGWYNTVAQNALLALTYGQFFNDSLSGSVTLSSGFAYSDFERDCDSRYYRSHPKSWSLGLSPMLIYYTHKKVPVDLFLGGDLYYAHRFSVEESSRSLSYTYGAEDDLLWRIKAGPSYTMKREGKRRLYQLRFFLAGNVQSQIPDRFTVAPNVLFESQPNNGRGGYLFELGLNLGKFKKLWNIAYGLRF